MILRTFACLTTFGALAACGFACGRSAVPAGPVSPAAAVPDAVPVSARLGDAGDRSGELADGLSGRPSPDGRAPAADPANFTRANSMSPGGAWGASDVNGEDTTDGIGQTRNTARKIQGRQADGRLYLRAEPGVVMAVDQEKRMRLLLVNGTKQPATFDAEDGRLSVVQEAKDAAGRWHPIERLGHSWCGNSYHSLTLAGGEYWQFAVRRYAGTFKTTLRFVLTSEKVTLLSNEFEGSIDPAQFDVPPGLRPDVVANPPVKPAAK